MRITQYTNAIYSLICYSASFSIQRYTGRPWPSALSVELTNRCNLKCPECATGSEALKRPKGFIELSLVDTIVDSLKRDLLSVNLYFQGEPMMHPQFFEITEKCRGINGIVSTNGHFLTAEDCSKLARSGLKKIIVSFDGVSQSVYSVYRRGGDIGTVTEGLLLLSEEVKKVRHSPRLELLFLYGKHNAHELKMAESFSKSIGASFKVKSMQVIHSENAALWIPENGEKSRYEFKDGIFTLKKSKSRGCLRAWTTPVVTWDGNVVPCCFDKDAQYVFGNIREQPFEEIWNGPERRRFITEVLSDRSVNSVCRHCPEGLNLFY